MVKLILFVIIVLAIRHLYLRLSQQYKASGRPHKNSAHNNTEKPKDAVDVDYVEVDSEKHGASKN